MPGKSSVRLALLFVFLICFFYAAPVLQSCSEGPDPFDDFSVHPDVPLEKFAAGRLGIVKPTFARSYLVVAFRYASGAPLTKDEQLAASALWENRVGQYSYNNGRSSEEASSSEHPRNPYFFVPHEGDAATAWLNARRQVLSSPAPQINQLQGGRHYEEYLNCADDALSNAGTFRESLGFMAIPNNLQKRRPSFSRTS
jgi:hypothetical protein